MQCTLKNVRLAFPALFKAQQVNGQGDPKYSASFIISPDNEESLRLVKQALSSVAKEKWADKAKDLYQKMVAADKVCLKNGDDKDQYDGFEGNMYVNASSPTGKPVLVVDRNKNRLTEEDGRPYAGCYVNAGLDIWAQDNSYGKRINASLRWVQFVSDGPAFSGSAPASTDEIEDLSVGDVIDTPATAQADDDLFA